MNNKTSTIVLLVVGALILLVSIFADSIGLGEEPGLGFQQTIGVIFGAVVLALGAYLYWKVGQSGGSEQADDGAGWLDSLTKAEEVSNNEAGSDATTVLMRGDDEDDTTAVLTRGSDDDDKGQ